MHVQGIMIYVIWVIISKGLFLNGPQLEETCLGGGWTTQAQTSLISTFINRFLESVIC